ncbi:hypothetical protein V8E36_002525 [Tilletia maclaganii]
MASRSSALDGSGHSPGASQSAYASHSESPATDSLSQPLDPDSTSTQNPYANHPQLSSTESALLFEYHKLASTLKRIQEISYPLASPVTHTNLLQSMRVLERKMGLVLTLFKASVWALLVEQQDAAEAEAAAQAAATAAGSGVGASTGNTRSGAIGGSGYQGSYALMT